MYRTSFFSTAFLLFGSCLFVSAQTTAVPQSSFPNSPGTISLLAGNTTPDLAGTSSSSDSSSLDSLDSDDQSNTSPQQNNTHANPEDLSTTQTKRILGVIPNFRSVSANQKLPPQTPKQKFMTATLDTFDYSAVLLPAVVAGYSQLTNATPEFHQGAAGYGRYFWHSYVDQAIENYSVEFLFPVLTHQDNRYYTMGNGGFLKRTGYSLSRAVITRNDAGRETFNTSEVAGAAFASGLSNLYYPAPERTVGNTMQKFGLNVGIDAATFFFKEFWPDVNNALFHMKD